MSQTTVAGSFITVNTIDSDHYVDGSINLVHIGANQIDGTKLALASQAAGDIMYYNGTDWIRLAKGSADEVLTMNDGASAPGWEVAGSGAVTREGGNTTGVGSPGWTSSDVEATTASTSDVDLLTASSLTIGATSPLSVLLNQRKTSGHVNVKVITSDWLGLMISRKL